MERGDTVAPLPCLAIAMRSARAFPTLCPGRKVGAIVIFGLAADYDGAAAFVVYRAS